jgi:hypothetical protein
MLRTKDNRRVESVVPRPPDIGGPSHVLVRTLERQDRRPMRLGGDAWWGWCPAHVGTRAGGLLVRRSSDGTCILSCRSGCNASEIAAALGLTLKDLFSDAWMTAATRRGGAR